MTKKHVLQGIGTGIVPILCLSQLLVGKINASTLLFADDFDTNSLENWTVVRNQQWNNPSQPCLFNSYPAHWEILSGELGIFISGPPCVTEIIPNSLIFDSDLSTSYDFDWHFVGSVNADRNVLILWKDASNWYDLKITNNNLLIQKVINGVSHPLPQSSTYYNFSDNATYHFSVVRQNNKISIFINSQLILETTDLEPYLTGSVSTGLQASVGAITTSSSFFDNVLVYSLDDPTPTPTPTLVPTNTPTPPPIPTATPTLTSTTPTPTPTQSQVMPHFKQTDPAWGADEYDTASTWSPSSFTMSDLGCAVTSMAMILRSHGIQTMPNGQTVTPKTLNTWLKTQPDGYLGQSLLNWVAVTRLTSKISALYGTTKLEYKRINTDNLSVAAAEINAHRPVIANIPGHFLVADGVVGQAVDLRIKDPYYNYTLLSEHNKDPLSYRSFTPSHTDLSYLLTTINADILVRVLDPMGADITQDVLQSEYISAETSNSAVSTPLQVLEILKPITGTYTLILESDTTLPVSLKFLSYNQAGEVTEANWSGTISPESATLSVKYNQDGTSSVSEASSWQHLKLTLQNLIDTKQLKQLPFGRILQRLCIIAEHTSLKHQKQIKRLMTNITLSMPAKFITKQARTTVLTELQQLPV